MEMKLMKRFNEIMEKEVRLKLAEAFLILEYECKYSVRAKALSDREKESILVNVEETKKVINHYIDEQIRLIIGEMTEKSTDQDINIDAFLRGHLEEQQEGNRKAIETSERMADYYKKNIETLQLLMDRI